MKIGDNKYNEHFHNMILESLVCGLKHPIEWVENYDRCIGLSYTKFNEINEFCDLVIKELYFWDYCSDGRKNNIEDVTNEEINDWINKHYKQGKYEN